MSGPVTVELPFPPSANSIWRYVQFGPTRRPILSKEYRAWRSEANKLLLTQKYKGVTGHFNIIIILDEGRRRSNLDIDNRIKPALDTLQRAFVIENDSMADSVKIAWGYAPTGCRVEIWPSEARKAA